MSAEEQTAEGRWIYGVVPSGAGLSLKSGDGQPEAWIVESGELAAIVGPVPGNDARATRDRALAHSKVLEEAVASAPVVPFRFGVIVPGGDPGVSRELLERFHDQLAPLLKKLEGVVQMTLKAEYLEDPLLGEILESEPEIARLRDVTRQAPEDAVRPQRIQLGEMINAAVELLRQRDATEILQALQPAVAAGVANPLEREYSVLNEAFLLERERRQAFERAVDAAAEERAGRMHFRLLGPMPAYDFIDLQEAAWA